jgi:TonB family protein
VKDRAFQPARKSILLPTLALLSCLIISCTLPLLAQNASKSHRKVIVMFDPEYPAVLKNGRFEGQVRINATVLANGTVSKVEVKGGNPALAQYASQAVLRWKYAPAADQTVEAVTFNFNPANR